MCFGFRYGDVVARRIRALCPEARLLMGVREPVARAWSHYHMMAGTDRKRTARRLATNLQKLGSGGFANAVATDLAARASVHPCTPCVPQRRRAPIG